MEPVLKILSIQISFTLIMYLNLRVVSYIHVLYILSQRRHVVKEELSTNGKPEKHDLTYYPTVHCIKNHIHQALKECQVAKCQAVPTSDVSRALTMK